MAEILYRAEIRHTEKTVEQLYKMQYYVYEKPRMILRALIGFGALAMLTARLLLPEIRPLLPLVDEYGCFILDEDGKKRMPGMGTDAAKGVAHEKSEAEILEEMEKLGM